ncbi:SDR family NAD(P)-dependent oxidoreductase [Thermomonospora echinospora]|uniref:SDR family NAD(P)-dependent oxidoreductase n=1 Tax=Thermomonospora echinospora TaxID=1992 RepID=UPI000CDEB0F1|nr:SDR family NAD(P)-dependent oxidoreductase [Thermomonospora echinospora]
MGALEGKSVILTGAGAGIGRAVVARYVAEGARVVAVDIDEEGLASLADECGGAVVPLAVDVRSWEGNVAAVRTAVTEFGGLDVLVVNAGITDGARPLLDIDGPDLTGAFQELFAVNVLAGLLAVRAAADALIASRGAVIMTGSYASFHASGGGALYTASKHALLGVVRQLAYELAPDVRVNGIAPGIAPTRLRGIDALGQERSDSVLEGTAAVLPLQEVPSTESYGGLYTLLANATDSGHVTGTMISADSGLSIRGLARPGGRVRTP